jgi:hypothetical protein
MGYKICCERGNKTLSFEISGDINHHIDAIALYVRAQLTETDADGALVDIRKANGRPGVARLFLHILKYAPFWRGRIALIDLEENHAFCAVYELLARRRGYEIRSFPDSDLGRAWLATDRISTTKRGYVRRVLSRLKEWPQVWHLRVPLHRASIQNGPF